MGVFEDHAKLFIDVILNSSGADAAQAKIDNINKSFSGKMGKDAGVYASVMGDIKSRMREVGISASTANGAMKKFITDNKDPMKFIKNGILDVDDASQAVLQNFRGLKQVDIGSAKYKEAFTTLRKSMKSFGYDSGFITQATRNFEAALGDNNLAVSENGKFMDVLTKREISNAKATKMASMYSGRRFRGELLSLMFVAQGLSKTFDGLITPVLELAGVFDVWKATLITVLGPVLIPLSMFLINLMTKFMGMPEPMKKLIGVFVVLGAVLAGFVASAAALGIALASFGGLAGFFAVIGEGAGVMAAVVPYVLIFVSAFIALWRIFDGIAKSDWWKVLSGALIIIGMVIAAIAGAPVIVIAAIGGIIAAIVMLADKFKFVKGIIEITFAPLIIALTTIYDLIRGITQGKWDFATVKGFTNDMFSNLGIKKMATGGIVNKPTLAMVGEAGPEAVVPLDHSGGAGMGMVYNPIINVQVSGASAFDIDRIAKAVNARLYDDLKRTGIR